MTHSHVGIMWVLTALAATACSGETAREAPLGTEPLGTATSAFTTDPCATTGANQLLDIREVGDSATYYRPALYIDTICPAQGEERPRPSSSSGAGRRRATSSTGSRSRTEIRTAA